MTPSLPDAPDSAYFHWPDWVSIPGALLLVSVCAFFLTGVAATLAQPVDPQTVDNLPLAGWPWLTLNSVCFSSLAAGVSLMLALPPALGLRHGGRGRWALLTAVAGVAAMPWIVAATGWTQTPLIWGRAGSALESWLKQPPPGAEPLRLLLGATIQGAMGAPLALLLLGAFLPPPTPEEEAGLLSGTRWQVFRLVFLPLARLPLTAAWAALLLWHFNDFTLCDLLRIATWSTRVFTTTAGLSPSLALREYLWMAALNGAGFLLLSATLTRLARRRAGERIEAETVQAGALRPSAAVRWGGGAVFVVVACLWPLVALAVRLIQSPDATGRAIGACLESSLKPWFDGLQVAFATGLLAALLGVGLGLLCVGRVAWLRWSAWWTLGLLMAMASIGVVLPLKAVSQHLSVWVDLRRTHFFEIAACLLRALPWCMLLTVWHLQKLPRQFDEAARVDGADRGQIFRSLMLPYLAPLLPVAFLIGFALASLDLAPAVLLAPPDRQPLIVHLFNELHYDYNANLMVMALLIALPFPLLALPVAGWFSRGRVNRAPQDAQV